MRLKEKYKQLRKKGFTLIELIVVIAILGILVLLSAPKFLGYTTDAKLKQIQNDIRVYESQASVELMKNPELENSWVELTQVEIDAINTSSKALNKKGEVVNNLSTEDNYVLNLSDVKTNLKGQFIWTSNDGVVYYDENSSLNGSNSEGENGGTQPPTGPVDTDGDGFLDEIELKIGTSPSDPNDKPEITPDDHFTWTEGSLGYEVEGKGVGYFKYTGTGEETVIIPDEIDGHPMTSYYMMFSNAGADVKKVISINPNVTNMDSMFYSSLSTELDLSRFDTSNVTNMYTMFRASKATTLDLNNFDTSKVTNMGSMFYASQATSLDLSGFDTSNVENMTMMFVSSKATSLDMSNWNTSNVRSMYSMFRKLPATTLDLSDWNTANVTDMAMMFEDTAATSIVFGENFDTSSVTTMNKMFYLSKATELDLSNFNTANVTNMSSMFAAVKATTLDLSSFDTSKATNMSNMFQVAKATTGLARTQVDADRLNASTNKPAELTFVVK